MKHILCQSLCMFCFALWAVPTEAATWQSTFSLDGLQETPPVATPGFGTGMATLDTITRQFDLSGNFSGLIGTTNNAHVHGPAPPGTPAGVMFGITFDFGVNSGNFSFSGVISEAHRDIIVAGDAYINIHSTFRPGGEIRGQMIGELVPEPGSLAIVGMGFASVFFVRHRFRAEP